MALTTDLISYYKLDDNLATTAVLDAHGSNDGVCTVNTNTIDVDGIIETSLNFNGTSTKVNIADGGDLSFTPGTDSYSISGWFYRDEAGVRHVAYSDGIQAESSYYMRFNSANTITIWAQDGGVVLFAITTTATVPATTWTHVVLTVSTTNVKLYLNGVYVGTDTVDAGTPTSDGVVIGSSGDAVQSEFDGRIDELGIWERVLTDGGIDIDETATGEIAELYNSGSGFAYPFTVDKTIEPSTQTLSLSGETSKAIVLDSPLSLSTSLTGMAPVPAIIIFPSTLELTSVGNDPPILQEPDTLILKLLFKTPSLNILNNTWRNPNYGTKSTKIISNLDIPDGIGGVMNLLPETSHVLSKKRVGLGML